MAEGCAGISLVIYAFTTVSHRPITARHHAAVHASQRNDACCMRVFPIYQSLRPCMQVIATLRRRSRMGMQRTYAITWAVLSTCVRSETWFSETDRSAYGSLYSSANSQNEVTTYQQPHPSLVRQLLFSTTCLATSSGLCATR